MSAPDPLKNPPTKNRPEGRDLYTELLRAGASPRVAAFVETLWEESWQRREEALDLLRAAERARRHGFYYALEAWRAAGPAPRGPNPT